ncbi:hypothetical protein QE450_004458 [Paenibacillus sp. SORGH_AS306]|nr:hypothetical protein [Paenibacillus sp. SORGH_AS_0306]
MSIMYKSGGRNFVTGTWIDEADYIVTYSDDIVVTE